MPVQKEIPLSWRLKDIPGHPAVGELDLTCWTKKIAFALTLTSPDRAADFITGDNKQIPDGRSALDGNLLEEQQAFVQLITQLATENDWHVIFNQFEQHAAAATEIHVLPEFTKLLTQMFNLHIPAKICELYIYYTGHGVKDSGNWVLQGASQDEEMSAADVFNLFSSANTQIPTTLCSDCCSSGSWLSSDLSSYAEYPLRIITAAAHGQTALVGNLLTFLSGGILQFCQDEDCELQTPGLMTTSTFDVENSILKFPPQYTIADTHELQIAKGKAKHFRKKEVQHHGLREERRNLAVRIQQGKCKEFNNYEGYLPELPKGQAYYEGGHPDHATSGSSMTAMGVVMSYDTRAKKLGDTYFSPTHYGQHRITGVPDPKDPLNPNKNRRNVFGRIAFQQIPKAKPNSQQL